MDFFAKLKQLFGGGSKGSSTSSGKKMPRVDVSKRFELLGRTGQGSMSKVWRARDKQTGKTICLKVLDKIKTQKFEARFVGLKRPPEGVILAELRHPHIVTTYEHGLTKEGEQYMVMELVDGGGLNFLIETNSKQLAGKRINYLTQIAEAIEFTHKKGYLHRDICPRNIMVTRDDDVKLIDFGLAVPYKPEFCKPGNRTGTPAYLAPEIIRRQQTDHRVDLFALGVTAYELYTGALPWEKAASLDTLLQHMRSPGRDPREVLTDMDEETAAFLKKGIALEPNRRFQHAADFREGLRKLPEA